MRDGYRIIDTDTHVGPTADVLYEYGSQALRDRRADLAPYEFQGRDGTGLSINPYPYKRSMGDKGDDAGAERGGTPSLKGKTGSNFRGQPQAGVMVKNATGRLSDMDAEGRDVDVIIPGTFATAVSAVEPDLGRELHAAYNRYIVDYCSADTDRLKATVLAPGWDAEWAGAEIRRVASEKCVAAVTVVLPEGLPIDDPDLHPIWQAMADNDLPILHHSFFYEPPYFPGYRDVWGQIAIARAAAHPWGAQRLLGYALLSGLFDQYPNLRIGFAECSAGWLPAWLSRLDGQADYLHASLPPRKMSAMEYALDGRVFCGVDLYEGAAIVRSIIEVMGDGALMFQSDYPHDQCYFPESTTEVLGWGLPEETTRKLMSENAERYLRMASSGVPRVPLVPADSDDPTLAPIFDVFRNADREVPVLYRALGNAPVLLKAWTDFAWPLRNDATTPRSLRELAILRVAQLTGADFEWKAHAEFALRVGVTQERLDALAKWRESDLFSDDERAVLAVTEQLTTNLEVDDETFAPLTARWTPAEVVELVLTISFYSCVSRTLNALQIH